jgi:hypothetical protein
MATNIKDIIENTKTIYMTDSSITTLLDFERVIDELDVYAFENWKYGEVVSGPIYEKYFVTCTLMWPYTKMPDPRGGQRLLDYGCEISYKKDVLKYPIKVKSYTDFESGTKMPKLAETGIWLVEIVIPKKLMKDIRKGSLELASENIDAEDIEQAYETGLDDKMYKTGDKETSAPESGLPTAPQGL